MKQRVVLVTGAEGGIGSATCELFSDRGWYVVGTGRRQSSAKVGYGRFFNADISKEEDIKNLISSINADENRLDAIINNAAYQFNGNVIDTPINEWDMVHAVNLRAPFLICKYGFELLKKSKGAVVNVSSVHAVATSKKISAYATSKGGIEAFTRAIAIEWASFGIRVNSLLPGAVDTQMLRAGFVRGHLADGDVEAQLNEIGKSAPLGRVGQPEEIAKAIYFLSDSNESSFITGQSLIADGGVIAKLSSE